MKYLQTFENFKAIASASGPYPEVVNEPTNIGIESYAPGDIISIMHEGAQKTAKIEKVLDNVFIVNVEENQQFSKTPVKISNADIIGMVKSNSDPAMNNDIMNTYQNRISNDLVINGFPKAI